jgi:hypothetical protein
MNLLNLEDEKFETKKIGGYEFKYHFISPMDRVRITQRRTNLQESKPVECLTQDEYVFFENIATIDVCTDELPKEFNKNESCIKWQDINLINELAGAIREHTSRIEEKLKKNKPVS